MSGKVTFTRDKIAQLSDRQRETIIDMHRRGYSLTLIGKRYGLEPKRVRMWLEYQNVYDPTIVKQWS